MSNGTFASMQVLGYAGNDAVSSKNKEGELFQTAFSLAVSESWTTRDGESREETQWYRVCLKGKAAKLGLAVHKGDKVFVEGTPKSRKYNDKDGIEKSITELEVVGFNSRICYLSPKPEAE